MASKVTNKWIINKLYFDDGSDYWYQIYQVGDDYKIKKGFKPYDILPKHLNPHDHHGKHITDSPEFEGSDEEVMVATRVFNTLLNGSSKPTILSIIEGYDAGLISESKMKSYGR